MDLISARKKVVLSDALEHGIVQIHVRGDYSGVTGLPDKYIAPLVILNLSWGFKCPLDLGDKAVRATLSFDQENWQVVLPWQSIVGLVIMKYHEVVNWPTVSGLVEVPAPGKKANPFRLVK